MVIDPTQCDRVTRITPLEGHTRIPDGVPGRAVMNTPSQAPDASLCDSIEPSSALVRKEARDHPRPGSFPCPTGTVSRFGAARVRHRLTTGHHPPNRTEAVSKYPPLTPNRVCPTNGSDRASLRNRLASVPVPPPAPPTGSSMGYRTRRLRTIGRRRMRFRQLTFS